MKKNIIFLCAFAILSLDIDAQLTRDLSSFSPLKSPNQQIIEKVVNSGVFIIKQSYELADSLDNRYGLSGNKAFGVDYTLAVKVKNGFLVNQRTVNPWDYNPLFDQYRGEYTPKPFPSLYSEVSVNCKYDTITIKEDELKVVFPDMLYAQESEQFFGDGFSLGGEVGENDGWIVWFTKKKDSDLGHSTDLNLSIIQKKQTITQKESGSYYYQVDSLQTSEYIIGGIFIIPEIISVGQMEMKLCGIVCRIDNGWILCCPFVNDKEIFKDQHKNVRNEDTSRSNEPKLTLNLKEGNNKSTSKKNKKKIYK